MIENNKNQGGFLVRKKANEVEVSQSKNSSSSPKIKVFLGDSNKTVKSSVASSNDLLDMADPTFSSSSSPSSKSEIKEYISSSTRKEGCSPIFSSSSSSDDESVYSEDENDDTKSSSDNVSVHSSSSHCLSPDPHNLPCPPSSEVSTVHTLPRSSSSSSSQKTESSFSFSLFFIFVCYLCISLVVMFSVNEISTPTDYFSYLKFVTFVAGGIALGIVINLILYSFKKYFNFVHVNYIITLLLIFFLCFVALKMYNNYSLIDFYNNLFFDVIIIIFSVILGLFVSLCLSKIVENFFLIVCITAILIMNIISTVNCLLMYYYSFYEGIDWCVILFIALIANLVCSGIFFDKFLGR